MEKACGTCRCCGHVHKMRSCGDKPQERFFSKRVDNVLKEW